jgi:hypothetical protein
MIPAMARGSSVRIGEWFDLNRLFAVTQEAGAYGCTGIKRATIPGVDMETLWPGSCSVT